MTQTLFGPYGTQLKAFGEERGFTVNKPTDVLGNSAIAQAIGDIADLYLDSGASVITVRGFDSRSLLHQPNGLKDYREVTERNLQIILERLQRRRDLNREQLRILFSLGPKNDCYEPTSAPDVAEAAHFHRDQVEQVEALSREYGIPLTAQFETQPSGAEAEGIALALKRLKRDRITAVLSYPFTAEGKPLGEESFADIIRRVDAHQNGLRIQHGLNCGPIEGISKALQDLGVLAERISVVYPNASSRPQKELESTSTVHRLINPKKTAAFLRYLAVQYGLQVIGGCCGYDHESIRLLSRTTESSSEMPPTDLRRVA